MRWSALVAVPALLLALVGMALSDPTPPPGGYKFVENTDRWVGVNRGEWILIGKLDKAGEFVSEQRVRQNGGASAVPAFGLLNETRPAATKAYEFRSGTLIPGELQKDGTFVPEIGGKVIAFADYKYTPEAPRIWNLPGGFEPVQPPAKK